MIEKNIKDKLKNLLKLRAPNAHCFMPVQSGFGSPDLDFVITINGFALRVETKIDRKQPTARQLKTISNLVTAGAVVLIIDQHNIHEFEGVVSLLVRGQHRQAYLAAEENRQTYSDGLKETNQT